MLAISAFGHGAKCPTVINSPLLNYLIDCDDENLLWIMKFLRGSFENTGFLDFWIDRELIKLARVLGRFAPGMAAMGPNRN